MRFRQYSGHFTIALGIAAALGALGITPTAEAQDEGASGALEEIMVTARRREENLQDVPAAVTAFSSEDLELRGTSDITEVAQSAPSVTLEPTRATNSTLTAFIRGIGQQDPLAGFEQGVALYIDDVYIARPQGALLDIYDVERVEVLRGPQGTLYGRNAVGGAIKYVTRRLGNDPSFSAKASIGTYSQQDLVLTGSVPVSDTFRVGATLASLNRDGYGDNLTTGADNYNKEILAYRVSAEFEPTDNVLVRIAYDKTEDDSDPVAGHRVAPAPVSGTPVTSDVRDTFAGASQNVSTSGINGNQEVESEGFTVSIDWDLNDSFTLRSITAVREDFTESVIDFDSLEVDDFDAPVIYDNEQTSQEFQLLFSGDRMNAVAGLYYLDASAANDFDVVLGQLGRVALGSELTAYTGGSVDTKAWSLFADLTYDLTDDLSVSIGGRYTEDERSADIFRAQYLGAGGSPFFGNSSAVEILVQSDYEAKRTYDDFTPRINFAFRLNDDTTVYAGYSEGFKAGSFDPRGANFVTPEAEAGFEPETLDSIEVGYKATLFDGRARANMAVFFSDYEDVQIPGSVGVDSDGDGINDSFVGAVTNAGAAEISGVEFEGDLLITDNLSAQLSFSFLDAEYTEFILGGVDVSDQRAIQNTPESMAYLGLTYTTDLFNGSLAINGNLSYRGEIVQFEVPAPIIDQDSYTLYNLSAVWISDDDHWSVGVHGKNLGDEDFKTAGYCFGATGSCPLVLGLEDNTTIFYGPPRTVTATVEYRF
ncbi:MAG: TonB-dependent receptor [Woeseiaceae bacterium]|nr:TonB-dependent receptor [Woeseiaceae bacterium]